MSFTYERGDAESQALIGRAPTIDWTIGGGPIHRMYANGRLVAVSTDPTRYLRAMYLPMGDQLPGDTIDGHRVVAS